MPHHSGLKSLGRQKSPPRIIPNTFQPEVNAQWQLEQETEASVLGAQFAQAIASIAVGQYKELAEVKKKKKKVFPPFKKIFYDEIMYNPPLANTHMNYEYEAHFKEEQKYWKNHGQRFSNDPRLGDNTWKDRGPNIPQDFPSFFEKPVKVYGRTREIRPFDKAHQYQKPVERTLPRREKNIDRAAYANYKLPDPWSEATKPVCGVLSESSIFKSKTPRMKTEKAHESHRQESIFQYSSPPRERLHSSQEFVDNIFESSTYSASNSPKMNASFNFNNVGSSLDQSESFVGLPGILAAPQQYHQQQQQQHQQQQLSQSLGSRIDLENSQVSSFFESQQNVGRRPSTEPNNRNQLTTSTTSQRLKSADASRNYRSNSSNPNNKTNVMKLHRMRSHTPGFSFHTSTVDQGVPGGSNASIFSVQEYNNPVSYRRIQGSDSKMDLILGVKHKDETTEFQTLAEKGAKFSATWAQTQFFAEQDTHLQMSAKPLYTPVKATNNNKRAKSASTFAASTTAAGKITNNAVHEQLERPKSTVDRMLAKYTVKQRNELFSNDYMNSYASSVESNTAGNGNLHTNSVIKSSLFADSVHTSHNNSHVSYDSAKNRSVKFAGGSAAQFNNRAAGTVKQETVGSPSGDKGNDGDASVHTIKGSGSSVIDNNTYNKQVISNWTPPVTFSKTSLKTSKEPSLTHSNLHSHAHSAGAKRPITPATTALSRSTKLETIIPVSRLSIKGKPNLHLYSVPTTATNSVHNSAHNSALNSGYNTMSNSFISHSGVGLNSIESVIAERKLVKDKKTAVITLNRPKTTGSIYERSSMEEFTDDLSDYGTGVSDLHVSHEMVEGGDADLVYATAQSKSILRMLENQD